MNHSNKKEACDALGNKNFFTLSATKKFLAASNYLDKKSWVKDIQQDNMVAMYATVLENDISHQKRVAYRLLSKIQLEELIEKIKNDIVVSYAKLQLLLHDGSIISNRQKILQKTNELEVKIIKNHQMIDTDELRYFLLISVLFADKHFLYDMDTKAYFNQLCSIVKSK